MELKLRMDYIFGFRVSEQGVIQDGIEAAYGLYFRV